MYQHSIILYIKAGRDSRKYILQRVIDKSVLNDISLKVGILQLYMGTAGLSSNKDLGRIKTQVAGGNNPTFTSLKKVNSSLVVCKNRFSYIAVSKFSFHYI